MKKRTRKYLRYMTTFLLVFVMFISSMPYSMLKVFADEVKDANDENRKENVFVQPDKLESTNIDDSKRLDEAYIVDENIKNRTTNSKEFTMSDGTVLVQQFAQNVHYFDGDSFEEIDNTLIETKNEEGETIYENKANFYKVKINKDFKPNDKLIEIKNGGHELNFTYIDNTAKNVVAKEHSVNSKQTVNEYKGKKIKTPKDFSTGEGKISYNDISKDINLEYEVKENGIKENIIVKDYLSDYNFDFRIDAKNVYLKKNEDGSISALDISGNVKYLIPTPFMFDANGEYNYDVNYILTEMRNEYILTISADENWIETQAKLPVTIDPIIETWNNTDFSFVNVYETGSGTQSTSEVYVGEKDSGNKSNAYFRFELPFRNYNYTLVNASIRFHHRTEGMGIFKPKNIKYSVNVVDSEMLLSNITYANKPSRLQFLQMLGANTNLASTEETHELNLDLNTIKGDVVTIGFERESANSSGGYVKIYTTGSNGIYLTMRYKQITGLDDTYSMESASINGVTAYVNKASRMLTLNCDVASVNNSETVPLEISLVYNEYYNEVFNELGIPVMFGNNFKLNLQQYVRVVTNDYIALYDTDGSVTILNYDTDYTYRTKDGKLTAWINGSTVEVFDTQLNKRIFVNGRLHEMFRGTETTSGHGYTDRIVINYVSSSGTDAEKISEVLFYPGESPTATNKITFTYSGTTVTSLTTYYRTTSLIEYTLSYDNSGNLTTVSNTTASVDIYDIEYDSYEGYLNAIFNKENEGFYFTYSYLDNHLERINQVMGENSNNAKWFDFIEFIYNDYSSLAETYYYENGNMVGKSYTSFDSSRNPISEWTEDKSGKITGLNRGYHNFEYSQYGYLYDYTKEDVYFEEKLNTNFTNYVNLSAGQTASGTVDSSSGITNNSYYKYGLTFLVECRVAMDLTVTFAGQSKRIVLDNGGKLYVTLPCGYVQTGVFVFKNNGSNTTFTTKISNVTYNVIDYVKETKSYGSEPANYNVYATTEIISYNKKGEYEQRIYDGHGRLVTLNQRSIEDNTLETTTYNYVDNLNYIYEISNITTKRNGTTTFSQDYTYFRDREAGIYEKTIITTANGLKKKSYQRTESSGNTVIVKNVQDNIETIKTYSVLEGNLRLVSTKSGNLTESYDYDLFGNVTSITVKDSTNNEVLSSTNLTSDGIVTGHTFANNTYTKSYDSLGFITAINHNGNAMLSYEYVDDLTYSYDDYLQKVTYANGQTESYNYGSATTVTYRKGTTDSNPDIYNYNYDDYNRLTSSNYNKNGAELLNYNYGDLNSTTQSVLSISGLSFGAQYTANYNDVLNRVTSTTDKFTKNNVDTTYTTSYGYNYKGQIISNNAGSFSSSVTYDTFDRLSGYVAKNGSTSIVNKTYAYDTYSSDGITYTTDRLKSITDNLRTNVAQSTYNANGYIATIKYNDKTFNYTYDDIGRLNSETIDGTTRTYTYNSANAIVSVSTGGTYTYDSLGRMIKYTDGTSKHFRYDDMGNPIMYKGSSSSASNNFVWSQGRKLESGTLNSNTFSYAYDMNGLRYKKTVNGNVTEYYLDGSTIIAENRKTGTTDNLIYYIYDMMGLSGMVYNGENYYYEKNTLGDIVRIRNSSGTIVANYSYDAWGNILTKSGTMADVNPFRYRGYYYDNETGFYYLQTRYYDPSIRMFINADNYELIGQLSCVAGQLNLYAYANNNPIMLTDESGELVLSTVLIGALIGFGVSFASSAIMQAAFNSGNVNWGIAFIDGVFGAIAGAVGGLGISAWAVGGINAGLSFINGVITTGIEQNWQFSTMDWGVIAGTSLLSGFISMRFYNQSVIKATNSFTSKISSRISSGYYGTGARAAKSIASATSQANKMVVNAFFPKGFYKEYLASLANMGLSQWGNMLEYYLV